MMLEQLDEPTFLKLFEKTACKKTKCSHCGRVTESDKIIQYFEGYSVCEKCDEKLS